MGRLLWLLLLSTANALLAFCLRSCECDASVVGWGDYGRRRRQQRQRGGYTKGLIIVEAFPSALENGVLDDATEVSSLYLMNEEEEEEDVCMADFPGFGSSSSRRRRRRSKANCDEDSTTNIVQLVNRVRMWPPWPLSLLQRRGGEQDSSTSGKIPKGSHAKDENNNNNNNNNNNDDDEASYVAAAAAAAAASSNTYPSAAALFGAHFVQKARIGVRQLREVGSSLWFHLPPAVPPLLFLASLPRKTWTVDPETAEMVSRRVTIPLFSNPFARTLVLSGFGVAVLSWAHQELHRKRQLTPLPCLAVQNYQQRVSSVFLPPFLPELVPEPEIEALEQSTGGTSCSRSRSRSPTMSHSRNKGTHTQNGDDESDDEDDDDDEQDKKVLSLLSPKLRKHFNDLYESAPLIGGGSASSRGSSSSSRVGGPWKEWKRVRKARKRESAKIRRLAVFDELVALQAIKRKSARRLRSRKRQSNENSDGESASASASANTPGYALVTGASQGLGRALAVELARWEIPLVLVARDLDRLIALAYDLEACYGVKCCVLQADLSQVDAAERIHEATTRAGITVDILVANAGIAYEGRSTDMPTSLIERMIMINTMSYAKLSKLYGGNMIERGRGRMLMVSSMAGLTSASPNTALYGATKAFEKSLALSMAKELEPSGVGVTCLMPGPVSNTQFRARSGTAQSLCWYLPYYPRPAETVAHLGVMSLLDGDSQVIPGWQNRAFAQLFRPILPQRVETMAVQAAWSPLRFPSFGLFGRATNSTAKDNSHGQSKTNHDHGIVNTSPLDSVHLDLKPRYNYQQPPRLLQLQEQEASVPLEQPEVANPPEESSLEPPRAGNSHSSSSTMNKIAESDTPTSSSNQLTASGGTPMNTKIRPPLEDSLESPSLPAAPPAEEKAAASPSSDLNKSTPRFKSAKNNENRSGTDGGGSTAQEVLGMGLTDHHTSTPTPHWLRGDVLSPQLGPMDLFQHQKYALPKTEVTIKDRKYTVQT